MEVKITNKGLFASALVLAIGIAIGGGGLYTVSESEKGVFYKVHRVTGQTYLCTPSGCSEKN